MGGMMDVLLFDPPCHAHLALLPSFSQWLVIGVFGALFVGRWLLAGKIAGIRRPREHLDPLERVHRIRIPICFGMASICFLVGLELMRDSRWGQGFLIFVCAGAAGVLGFALGQKQA